MNQPLGHITWCDSICADAPPCPACGSAASKRAILETASAIAQDQPETLRLVACQACGTRFWTDNRIFHYEEPAGYSWGTRFYVEQGASIDGLLEPIARLPTATLSSCLEIGCGFGFSLDASRMLFGWRVLGVDPSPLARAGRAALDLDIRSIYATADSDLGGPFDVVYGSEVIEHVATPHEFLAICRAHLAPGGMLVLTTPDGDCVRPDVPASALMPILSPGHHLILYSADSLAAIVRAAGFAHVAVAPRTYGLVLYASDRPLTIDRTAVLDRALFRSYLAGALAEPDRPAEIRLGLRYRLFKELVNAAEHGAATRLFDEIAADCLTRFGFALSPEAAAGLAGGISQGARSGDFSAPFCLPGLLFFRGMIAINHAPRPGDAAPWFDAAAATAEAFRAAYREIGIDDGETGMIEQRAPELALLALCRGDPDQAVARLRAQGAVARPLLEEICFTLLDLGSFAHARAVAALSPVPALAAMVDGWEHLVRGRDAEAHAALTEALKADGALARRARSADMLALASIDPAAALRLALAAQDPPVPLEALFMRLVDLGHLPQAAAIETAVSEVARWDVMGRRGMLALLHSRAPARAAALFADAAAAAQSAGAAADTVWDLKYHRLLALINAAASGDARSAALEFSTARDLPATMRAKIDALLAKHPAARPRAVR